MVLLIYQASHPDVLNAELYFENYSNRDMVLRDQKVPPEVPNQALLQRVFFSHQITENHCVRPIMKFAVEAWGYVRQIAKNTETNKERDETAIPSLMQNPTPNLLIKL